MKILVKTIFSTLLLSIFLSSVSFAQLYRNTEYQFSLLIPDYMEYRTPRGPNVKMTASAKSGAPNMNIIVKPNLEFAFSNDENLSNILALNQAYESDTRHLLNYGIIDIPEHRVLCTIWNIKYTYPNNTFYMTAYVFEFVSNYKYYCISYFFNPETALMHEEMVKRSIGSFVDETGWY